MSEKTEKTNVEETSTENMESVVEQFQASIERPYTLRKFKDGDLSIWLRILKKIGIKDCKEAFIQVMSGEKNLRDIGILASFDLADVLIGNLPKIEEEVYFLYSDLSGIPVEDIKEMEFVTLPLMIYDSIREVKNTAFFKVLSRLL